MLYKNQRQGQGYGELIREIANYRINNRIFQNLLVGLVLIVKIATLPNQKISSINDFVIYEKNIFNKNGRRGEI